MPFRTGIGRLNFHGRLWALARAILVASLCISMIDGAQAATVQYVYDELGRLIAEIDPASTTTRYTYDAAGNLLSVTRSSSSQVSVISFFPDHGKVGDTVTVFGSGFIQDPAQNAVSFAGTTAAVASASATSLVTNVPAGAVTGPITVTNANGSATSARAFTVIVPPVITAVSPNTVARGFVTRMEISGSNLAFATSVTFTQAGITAAILPGAADRSLPVNISVSASVPAGSYSFSVTNAAGTTNSGSITVTVGIEATGDGMSVSAPVSVFVPPPTQIAPPAPSGDSMSVSVPVSVFLPPPTQIAPPAPSGDSMSVSAPVSVFLPPPTQLALPAPSGDSMSVSAPVSVFVPPPTQIAPPAPSGDSMSVTQPVSVSVP